MTVLEFQALEKVNPLEFEYVGEVATHFESTNKFSKATCDELDAQLNVTVPATVAPSLGDVI